MIADKPLIIIVGPTAVGKTEVSIQLAKRFGGEIVSADSRLIYRWMDIGTGKPNKTEINLVPHHLIDVTEPDHVWNLAEYQRAAITAIDDILNRGKLPFLVGGTGQYIKSISQGWMIPAVAPDTRLRKILENWTLEISSDGLHDRLMTLDPEAAEKIEPQNTRRTIRALEVILISGKRFSSQRIRSKPLYDNLTLGITRPRPELYKRIDERIYAMMDAGFVDEVRWLMDKGYSNDLPPLSAIGYPQIIRHLSGEISLEESIIIIKKITRQFVRRQSNWFKEDDPEIIWFNASSSIVSELETEILQFLSR